MKRILAIVTLAISMLNVSRACDVCSCSGSSGLAGVIPQFNQSFIGIRQQHSRFQSTHLALFASETEKITTEQFNTTELWYRLAKNKWQFFATLPLQQATYKDGNQTTVYTGVADVTLLLNYKLIDYSDSLFSDYRHILMAGAGLKLPTRLNPFENVPHPNLAAGTGSIDFPLNVFYSVRKRSIGMVLEQSARVNLPNLQGYAMGHRMNSAMRFFYWKNFKQVTVLPGLGLSGDFIGKNKDFGDVQHYTGGRTISAMYSIEWYFKKVSFAFQAFQPLSQHIAEGQIKAQTRFSAQVFYLF